MIAMPQHGVVFLSMPKCASTAIERELEPDAHIITRQNPKLKHMNYRGFEKFVQPLLARTGHPRRRYEVVCVFREPIAWLHSWWRYRSRPQLAPPDAPRSRNYTGEVTFEEFCVAYTHGTAAYATTVGRQATFVQGRDGDVGVDRMFRYDDLAACVAYLSDRIGRPLDLEQVNVSPSTQMTLAADTRAALRDDLAPEYHIYERLTVGAAHPTGAVG